MANGYSLHIGLNAIDSRFYDGWDGALHCCHKDAMAMKKIAYQKGFAESKTLLDADATREAVESELRYYANKMQAGDLFFISYAGHGGSLPDLNGDEMDGRDETWCLYNGQMVDDELYKLYANFSSGTRVLVISDSCHSGSVVRSKTANSSISQKINSAGLRARMLPVERAEGVYDLGQEFYDNILTQPSIDPSEINPAILLLAGCQDHQSAYEPSSGENGVFTSKIIHLINDENFNGDYSELHRLIDSNMPNYQKPNLYQTGTISPSFIREQAFTI